MYECTYVCIVCMCVRVCVCVDDEAVPAGLGFGKDDECKTQEEGAKSDGIGRWEIFVASRDGRRKEGWQRNGRWTRWIFWIDFWREERKRRRGGKKRERERDAIKGVSQSVSAPKWVRIFFPLVLASGKGQHRN